MKKKGFTLVELLAVIAILAILIIIVLPNIMALFNQAKQNSFENEVKQIFRTSQQEWIKDSMFETKNIVYARCSNDCPKELELSGRSNIDYYVELDKSGNVIKLFASDSTYQYEYRGKGLKIEKINNSTQISKLESSDILKVSCNKIEKDGKDVTNTQGKLPVSSIIYWALQDNDKNSINETLVISNNSVSGNISGSFNGTKFFNSSEEVPWIKSEIVSSDLNLSYNVENVIVEEDVAPISTSYWFRGVGYNSSTFNADLSNLNVSNVTDMSWMFNDTGHNTISFNLDLSSWNTSKVIGMGEMFYGAGYYSQIFNVNLSNWDTSNVTYMSLMFCCAGRSSNTFIISGISNWNTSSVTNMTMMFDSCAYSAETFDLDVSKWNVSSVTNMVDMFKMTGLNATNWKITIPKNNNNGTNNTTSRMFGANSSIYVDASNSKSGRTFTLAS